MFLKIIIFQEISFFLEHLNHFLKEKGCNPHKTHSTERDVQDITIRQWLFGVITKYWPIR